jgi:hypothetical protein
VVPERMESDYRMWRALVVVKRDLWQSHVIVNMKFGLSARPVFTIFQSQLKFKKIVISKSTLSRSVESEKHVMPLCIEYKRVE